MNNYVILKWGSIKGYHFTDEFIKNNKEIVNKFENCWNEIYKNHFSATGGSDEVYKRNDLKLEIVDVLSELFELGVIFQNGWDDTYYNTFNEIKDYIMNYGG